jgi:hypothetical protein
MALMLPGEDMRRLLSGFITGFFLVLILSDDCHASTECLDIYLKDGRVIKGVKAQFEEAFKKKYVVYWYASDSKRHRIDALLIHHFEDAECAEMDPSPTMPPPDQKTEVDAAGSKQLWDRMMEIMSDGNEIRRKQRWLNEVKGKTITLCGNLNKITSYPRECQVEFSSRGPGNDSQSALKLFALFSKSLEFSLKELNMNQKICVTGKIADSSHIPDDQDSNIDPGLLELYLLMNPGNMWCDILMEDCRLEAMTGDTQPDTPVPDPGRKESGLAI